MNNGSIAVLTLTVIAADSLYSGRFITAEGYTADPGGPALGVSRTGADLGDPLPVDVLGTARIMTSGEIAKGQAVQVGGSGFAAAHSSGIKVGRALEAAATDGVEIEILLIPN